MSEAAFDPNTWAAAYRVLNPEVQELRVYQQSEDWRLDTLIVRKDCRKQGFGSAVMRELSKLADAHGKRLVLSVAQKDDFHGTTSRGRLVGFYKRFGFIENTGRRKDFTITAGMYRDPMPVTKPTRKAASAAMNF